jgi:hypothetical protein
MERPVYYRVSLSVFFSEWCNKNCVCLEDVSSYTVQLRDTSVALILGVSKAAEFVFLKIYFSLRKTSCYRLYCRYLKSTLGCTNRHK